MMCTRVLFVFWNSCHFTYKKTFFELQVLLDLFLLENDLHTAQRQRKEGSGSCEALGSPGQVKTCWMTGSRAGGGDMTEVTSEFIPPRGCSVKARLSRTLTY